MSSRSVTPEKKRPKIQISTVNSDIFNTYLEDGELLVSRGYPAPPSRNKEIRKCVSCDAVYMIVEKTSLKTTCGYCASHT